MNDTGWSRAYFVVAVLALILIPAGGFVARIATGSAAYVMRQMGIDSLPNTTAFFIMFGSTGYVATGIVSFAIIGGMAFRRHELIGPLVSAAVLVVCLCFFLFAPLSSHFPFWSIMYRLS